MAQKKAAKVYGSDNAEAVEEKVVNNKPWYEEIPEQVLPPENKPSGKKKPWQEDIPKQVTPPENEPSARKRPWQE